MTCEQCKKDGGSFYSFVIGRQINRTEEQRGGTTTTTTTYQMEDRPSVSLCQDCLNKHAIKDFKGMISGGGFIGAITGVMLYLRFNTGVWDDNWAFITVLAFALSLMFFLSGVSNLFRYRSPNFRKKYNEKHETGENLAIEIRRDQVNKKNISFFTPKHWSKLR
ncbi:MAG: hypothetical protein JXI43_07920 [Tissierellales bacterium]|nr:hypothetical protein [Tissierellales bacterium]